jgi:excisionase family DNA binding protein
VDPAAPASAPDEITRNFRCGVDPVRTAPLEKNMDKSSIAEQRALSIKQAIGAVPLSRSFLYKEIASGRLRSFTIGKRRLIAVADLDAWLAARRDAGAIAGPEAK